jgi:hypothetical protein
VKTDAGIEHRGVPADRLGNVARIVCDGLNWIFHEHGDSAPEMASAPAASPAPAVPAAPSAAEIAAMVAAVVEHALAKAGVNRS